jgi:hypothetical protein
LAQHVNAYTARMPVQETVLIDNTHDERDEHNGEEVFVPAHEKPGGMYFAHYSLLIKK